MTQLLQVAGLAAVSIAALGACSEVRLQAFEGQGCSESKSASTYYACDQTHSDLVCIATYTVGERMAKGFVCRLACTQNSDCPSDRDVCCAGDVVANPFKATKACVPIDKCQTDPAAVASRDAGADVRGDGPPRLDPGPDADPAADAAEDAAVDASEPL